MTTAHRRLPRFLAILILALAGLVAIVAMLIGAIMMMFPTTVTATFDVVVVTRHADGTPAADQEVELWGYEKPTRTAVTGPDGRAEFPDEYIRFTTAPAFSRRRPESFPLRLRFPKFAPLRYRYEIVRDGPSEADVFNTSYDYRFGPDWVGRFNADGLIVRVNTDEHGRPAHRAAPQTDDGTVRLFRAEATVVEIPGPGNDWRIELVLTPDGAWRPAGP